MADYRPDWEDDTVRLSREFFDKHPAECTSGELKAIYEIRSSRARLARIDRSFRELLR